MSLIDQVYAQAVMLCAEAEGEREELLRLFCQSAVAGLQRQLREGLTAEDCKADLVAAGALFALAALSESEQDMQRVEFADVTLVSGGISAASRCLRRQAQLIIAPYCKDSFSFRGV